MNEELYSKTGIYIAYPTSPVLKSIYKAGGYKTKVNDQHTKVGKAEGCFKIRRRQYIENFDNEVSFIPIAIIDAKFVEVAEGIIQPSIKKEFSVVGHAREWFHTSDRKRISDIALNTLFASGIEYETIQLLERND